MARFDGVAYDAAAGTTTIGAGLIWDDVYAALEPYGVNVVGGRVTGVGVAGFTLGGGESCSVFGGWSDGFESGYSFLSNQYGLTIDTVRAFELVLPNGTVTNVTESDADLFWALKVGSVALWFTHNAVNHIADQGGFNNMVRRSQPSLCLRLMDRATTIYRVL